MIIILPTVVPVNFSLIYGLHEHNPFNAIRYSCSNYFLVLFIFHHSPAVGS